MAKKVVGSLKLEVKAGQANPSPPIGPALGQRGLNIMEFCKTVNAATKDMEPGSPVPVVITYYQDKSFTLELKTPPASFLLKKAAKVNKGATEPGKAAPIGKVTMDQITGEAEGSQRE
jgi:large subunit ribosomal protein L11